MVRVLPFSDQTLEEALHILRAGGVIAKCVSASDRYLVSDQTETTR